MQCLKSYHVIEKNGYALSKTGCVIHSCPLENRSLKDCFVCMAEYYFKFPWFGLYTSKQALVMIIHRHTNNTHKDDAQNANRRSTFASILHQAFITKTLHDVTNINSKRSKD